MCDPVLYFQLHLSMVNRQSVLCIQYTDYDVSQQAERCTVLTKLHIQGVSGVSSLLVLPISSPFEHYVLREILHTHG